MWVNVYFIYLALCLAWFGIRYRRDRKEAFMRLAIVVCLPVIGLLLLPRRNGNRDELQAEQSAWDSIVVVPEDAEAAEARIYTKETADKEMNLIPLEEALVINDNATRRRVMIDLLKQDSMKYLDVLQLAVGNDDTETSHYAVSAIMEVKRKLTLAMQELSVRYDQDKSNVHLLRSYADVLKGYMNSGFLDERTLLKHRYTYMEVLGHLIEADSDTLAAFTEKIETELSCGLYAEAESTAQRFVKDHPRQETAYLMLMKVYYSRRSIGQLRHVVESMKQSPIRFSSQALGIVRYWTGEEEDKGEETIGHTA